MWEVGLFRSQNVFCEKCNKHVMKVFLRYCIKVRVIDETDSATFVIFDRDAMALFNNKTCADMFEAHDRRAGQGSIPNEINGLVDKSFLFKVECRNEFSGKFEQSFRVKKVCSDAAILNKFNDLYLKSVEVNSENVILGRGKQLMVEGSEIGLKQNLMGQFSQADGEMDSQLDEGCDLSKDSQGISPLKRDIATEHTLSELELPLKMLKKNIKIENN